MYCAVAKIVSANTVLPFLSINKYFLMTFYFFYNTLPLKNH